MAKLSLLNNIFTMIAVSDYKRLYHSEKIDSVSVASLCIEIERLKRITRHNFRVYVVFIAACIIGAVWTYFERGIL